MSINVTVDEDLIKKAERLTGEHDRQKLLQLALEEMIRARSPIQGMLDLVGKVRLRDDYDYKALRAGKSDRDND